MFHIYSNEKPIKENKESHENNNINDFRKSLMSISAGEENRIVTEDEAIMFRVLEYLLRICAEFKSREKFISYKEFVHKSSLDNEHTYIFNVSEREFSDLMYKFAKSHGLEVKVWFDNVFHDGYSDYKKALGVKFSW